MRIFTSKKNNDFFNIYDPKARLLISCLVIMLLIICYTAIQHSTFASFNDSQQDGGSQILETQLFDYIIPSIAAFVMFLHFYGDYQNNVHTMLAYLSPTAWHVMRLKRYCLYSSIFIVGSFVSALLYYREPTFLSIDNVLLSLSYLPNAFFLTTVYLMLTVLTKNAYPGFFVILSYVIGDYITDGRLFSIFTLGATTANILDTSLIKYLINRLLLVGLGIVCLIIAIRKK